MQLPRDEQAEVRTAGLDDRAQAVVARLADAERAAAAGLPSDDPRDPERLRRTRATWPELIAQPQVVLANWAANAGRIEDAAERIVRSGVRRVIMTGAGDSLAVMIAARWAMETMLGVPCEAVQCAELAYYPPPDLASTLVVALSSSGETTRTVQAVLVAQAAGALTLALTNKPASTLATESSATLIVDATRVGWPTQSSTAPLALLLRLAAAVGARRGDPAARDLASELDATPDLMARVIDDCSPRVAAVAGDEQHTRMVVFTGGGPQWASAIVGAAKVKECTPDHALAVHLEEFHHYNSVKDGEPVWLFAPAGPTIGRALDTVAEAGRLGGHVHAVTSHGVESFAGRARSVVHLPAVSETVAPLLTFLPAQLVGYHLAMAKFATAGADVA